METWSTTCSLTFQLGQPWYRGFDLQPYDRAPWMVQLTSEIPSWHRWDMVGLVPECTISASGKVFCWGVQLS